MFDLLSTAFTEADHWQSVRLSETERIKDSLAETSCRVRRTQCSSGNNNHQVSTTTRFSPESTGAGGDARRRFVVCPIYRARWGSDNAYYYFKTISLPFLRNQTSMAATFELDNFAESEGGGNNAEAEALQESSDNSVFSPTSSFENLLLLNYHCILG